MTKTSPILWMIRAYRKWLSPLKGWKCAHGQEHGRNTCSQVGLRIFTKTTNPTKGLLLLQRQFDRCADSAERLNPALLIVNPSKPFTRLLESQRGDCDPGCDGCDVGGCDMPDCGGCDAPTFSSPCSDPNPMTARSCDWSGCCDYPSCDNKKDAKATSPRTSAQRASMAAKREVRREKRNERRLAAHEARAKRRQAKKDTRSSDHDDDDNTPIVPRQENP